MISWISIYQSYQTGKPKPIMNQFLQPEMQTKIDITELRYCSWIKTFHKFPSSIVAWFLKQSNNSINNNIIMFLFDSMFLSYHWPWQFYVGVFVLLVRSIWNLNSTPFFTVGKPTTVPILREKPPRCSLGVGATYFALASQKAVSRGRWGYGWMSWEGSGWING